MIAETNPDRARCHITWLCSHGMTMDAISRASGLSRRTMSRITRASRHALGAGTLHRVLAVSVEAPNASAAVMRRDLDRLDVLGWSEAEIVEAARVDRHHWRPGIVSTPPDVAQRVRFLFEEEPRSARAVESDTRGAKAEPVAPETVSALDQSRWWERAACKGTDTADFFITRGGDETRALAVCARCRVRAECLADAEASGDTWSIRGGQTPHMRKAKRRFVAQWDYDALGLDRRDPDLCVIFNRMTTGEDAPAWTGDAWTDDRALIGWMDEMVPGWWLVWYPGLRRDQAKPAIVREYREMRQVAAST